MRIIAGTARSLPLKTIEGKDTRPTTDKTKETLLMSCSLMFQEHIFRSVCGKRTDRT